MIYDFQNIIQIVFECQLFIIILVLVRSFISLIAMFRLLWLWLDYL